MEYHNWIKLDHGRINYEVREFGSSIIVIPRGVNQTHIDVVIAELRAKYNDVGIDCEGDIIVQD